MPEKTQKELVITQTMKRLLNVLPTGKDRAAPAKELASLLRVDKRNVTSMINRLRMSGELIASTKSGSGGYFIPCTMDEAREYLGFLQSECTTLNATLQSQRKALTTHSISALKK